MDMKDAIVVGDCRMTLIKALKLEHVPPDSPGMSLQELCDLARMVIEGQRKELHDIDQTLGRALGYPGFPKPNGTIDESSVCTGEHVTASLADEAADVIRKYYRNPLVRLGLLINRIRGVFDFREVPF